MNRDRQQKKIIDYFNLWFKINLYITLLLFLRVGPVQNSLTLNLGTFQFKPLQDGHLSKADKNFCLVSALFREVLLYYGDLLRKLMFYTAMYMCTLCTLMEGSHHVIWNSIIYRKGGIHWAKIKRPFWVAKGFNSNLVQFLPSYHLIISSVHVCSFMCTISNVHGRAPKTISCKRNIVFEKL